MARTAIATDSNSGITQSQAKELGVFVLPMPFFMRGKIQFEDIDLTQEQFYEILAEDAAVSTSQPSPGDLMDFWNKILEERRIFPEGEKKKDHCKNRNSDHSADPWRTVFPWYWYDVKRIKSCLGNFAEMSKPGRKQVRFMIE